MVGVVVVVLVIMVVDSNRVVCIIYLRSEYLRLSFHKKSFGRGRLWLKFKLGS